jgi:hypothetical protein
MIWFVILTTCCSKRCFLLAQQRVGLQVENGFARFGFSQAWAAATLSKPEKQYFSLYV